MELPVIRGVLEPKAELVEPERKTRQAVMCKLTGYLARAVSSSMEELTVLAEIEKTDYLTAIPTVYKPGIWRYCLYATGGLLPFMRDTFNRTPVKVSNLIVDNEEYNVLETVNEMTGYEHNKGCWVNGGSVIYVRFPFYNPPYLHYLFRYGVLIGYTNNKPVVLDGTTYRSGLLSSPEVEHSADAFTFDRMKFNSASVTIDNSDGQFDDAEYLFGNEFNLLLGIIPEDEKETPRRSVKLLAEAENKQLITNKKTDEYITQIGKDREKPKPEFWKIAQYYIANITVGLASATFHLKDKRERLSAKIPNQVFTDELEYIDEKYIGKDRQEAYGRCFGVTGVCLEGTRIYIDKTKPNLGKITKYYFRFSSQISRVDRIQVKMTEGELPVNPSDPMGAQIKVDGWTTVYQLIPDEAPNNWAGWKPGIDIGDVSPELLARGEIALSTKVAKKKGEIEGETNEVRMDGVFNNPENRDLEHGDLVTPLDIIKDILYKYSSVPYGRSRYYHADGRLEIEAELERISGYEIGVLFDKSILIYEAIEKLQSGSVMGFQFGVYQELFTARLDNPNRPISRTINNIEITNLHEVEVDWNAEIYGTSTNIEYAHNYNMDKGSHFIDTSYKDRILKLHRIEKEWGAETLLANKEDAEKKSRMLLDGFSDLQPLIKNIKLTGKKRFDLRIYDIVEIDFIIHGEEKEKYPRHIIKLISEVGNGRLVSMKNTDEYVTLINEKETQDERYFIGELRCQILRIDIDTQTGDTIIDVKVYRDTDAILGTE
jgi:hypothetical protein